MRKNIKMILRLALVLVILASGALIIKSNNKVKQEPQTIITKGKFIESVKVNDEYNTKIKLEDGSIYEYNCYNELIMDGSVKYVSQGHKDGQSINDTYLIEVSI